MVRQSSVGMTTPCSEFTENAWRKDRCINCQRARGEHSLVNGDDSSSDNVKSSPVPAKRVSLHGKPLLSFNEEKKGIVNDWPIEDSEWCMIGEKSDSLQRGSDNVEETTERDESTASQVKQTTESKNKFNGGDFKRPEKSGVKNNDKMVVKKSHVSFDSVDPAIIALDGGWYNLLGDLDDGASDSGSSSSEEVSFTEEEREFVLQALENTMWNSDNRNLLQLSVDSVAVRRNSSKEFEDLNKLSLWKADRFSTLRDCDKIIPRRYGTFPTRNKMSKSNLEDMFDENWSPSSSDLIKESEELDNKLSSSIYKVPTHSYHSNNDETKDSNITETNAMAHPYKVVTVEDILNPGSNAGPALPKKSGKYDSNQDEDEVFGDDGDLFASFNPDIDLDASTAGDDLVDLLNDVLAKYSTDGDSFKGIEGHELLPDSAKAEIQNVVEAVEEGDNKCPKGSIKSKAFEAKLASLAKTLDLNKKKLKKPAPRPPSSAPPPPEPPTTKASNSPSLPEPSFKMVPIGRNIIEQGGSERPLSPKRASDFACDIPTETTPSSKSPKGEGKSNKKGITSFFRNILRRGARDSTDSLPEQESSSNDSVKSGGHSPTALSAGGSQDSGGSKGEPVSSSSVTNKTTDQGSSSPVMKMKVLPTVVKPPRTSIIVSTHESSKAGSSSPEMSRSSKASGKKVKDSPELSKKSNGKKGKESPKSSPKASRKEKDKTLERVQEEITPKSTIVRHGSDKSPAVAEKPTIQRTCSDKSIPTVPAKPPVAARVKPTNLPAKPTGVLSQPSKPNISSGQKPASPKSSQSGVKERSASVGSQDGPNASVVVSEEQSTDAPRRSSTKDTSQQARKRPKSPKRTTAPVRPTQPPKGPEKSSQQPSKGPEKNLFTKELEKKISKGLDQNKPSSVAPPSAPPPAPPQTQPTNISSQTSTISKSEPKKVTIIAQQPPPSPTSPSDVVSGNNAMTMSCIDALPTGNTLSSLTGTMSASFTMASSSLDTFDQGQSSDFSPAEKIELPNKAQSRKSFLGKLGNRKSRAPPRPPSIVKRTKSITENTLPGVEGHVKKIDISSPVLIQEMTSSHAVNRRNTITIGEDCSFVSGGSTSSGSTNDKYDEWPQFSPLGSIENLYEPIVPKEAPPPPPEGNMYDPVTGSQNSQQSHTSSCSSEQPNEGYLEPIRSTPPIDQNPREVIPTEIQEQTDISEERKILLASQPIYEEINGYGVKDVMSPPPEAEVSRVDAEVSQGEVTDNVDTEVTHADISDSVDAAHKIKLTVDVNLLPSDKDLDLPAVSPSPSQDSESSSACSTLNRPRPLPRKRCKRTESSGSDQPYIAMNRPSIAVALNEGELRDMLNQLTSLNLQTLRDTYTQYEKVFTKETVNLNVTGAGPIKFRDFDIYGKPLHSSERCIVYNAKMKSTSSACQLMLLHTKPDLTSIQHPSLLKPTVIFSDHIPFSYLTDDFIKTSQLLQNLQSSVNQSATSAKCFIAVGLFDICWSLKSKLGVLKDNISSNPEQNSKDLDSLYFYVLQLLSAISHCLDHGFTLGEANFRDVFIISNTSHSLGDIIAFLPHQQLQDTAQVESVCALLERYFTDTLSSVSAEVREKRFSCVLTITRMLQSRKLDCLANVRSYVEYLLWGPKSNKWTSGVERQSNLEPKLSMWLERERTALIHKFANIPIGSIRTCSVRDFYQMKFLLKSCAVSMTECMRYQAAYDKEK